MVSVARLDEIVDVPSSVAPSQNCTLPVTAPADMLRLAVSVTDCPVFDGFLDDDSVSAGVAAALLITCGAIPLPWFERRIPEIPRFD